MWQDYFFACSGTIYTISILPSLLNPRTEMPRSSSVPTASMVGLSAVAYGTLGMWAAASVSLVLSLAWAGLAMFRPVKAGK